MSDRVYRCVCYTCERETVMEGLANAQQFFDEHADRSHEVEIRNEAVERSAATEETDADKGQSVED
ncbi:hypothetical protein [Halopiger djelfimassiliensis]|uniref:hypothetical protein n=1 Tax=Halopiger djelfimassiliensis TaxID=1293047 RepID=UPI0006782926|nr:hypothetical protein [Halopiger djelfimassiliensis]